MGLVWGMEGMHRIKQGKLGRRQGNDNQNFCENVGALRRAFLYFLCSLFHLLRAGVLGDSFSSLRNGMLGQLSWQQKTNCCLDFTGGDG